MREISGKRNKTDSDYIELSNIEWQAGVYVESGVLVIPGLVIQATLENAAKKIKKGPQAKAGIFVDGMFPLEYEGTKDLESLCYDPQFRLVAKVRIGKNSVMRTRPKFDNWGLTFSVKYDEKQLSAASIKEIVKIGGEVIGLCDWRPRFGRYEIVCAD